MLTLRYLGLLTLVLLLLTMTTACSVTRGIGIGRTDLTAELNRAVCGSFRPISFSARNDTRETIKQVREHNAALESFRCP